jgi:hypothetical protein
MPLVKKQQQAEAKEGEEGSYWTVETQSATGLYK